MSDDIVTQLRNHIAITTRMHYAKDGFPEPVFVHGPSPICQEAADEIERLRKERDEARREVCRGEAMLRLQRNRVHRESEEVVRMAKEIAVERGWDCFKENS
jgi:hypothetical protein